MKLGGIYLSISAKTAQYKRDLASAKTMTEKAAVHMDNTISKISFAKVGIAATAFTAGMAAMTLKVVSLGRQFESTMKTVQAWSGATGDSLQRLNDIAREMGATTEHTATQAAGALKFLAAAGFDAEKSISALPGTLNLATAGQVALAEATDITTDVLTAFGLNVEELSRVNDAFITTSSSSNTNVLMLGQSMKMVAPTANLFGLSVEQTAAFLGTLANAGVKAEMAGSGLNMVLLKSQKAAKKLGMELDSSLIDVLKRMKEEQWDAVQVGEAFGARQVKTAGILMENIDTYEKLNEKIIENTGSTEKLAEIIRDGLDNDIKILNSTIQGEMLRTFDKYNDYMRDIVQKTTEWIKENPIVINQFASMTKGLASMAIEMAKIINYLPKILNAFTIPSEASILDKQIADLESRIESTIEMYNKEAKTKEDIHQESIDRMKKREEEYMEELELKRRIFAKTPFVNPNVMTQAEKFNKTISELSSELTKLKAQRELITADFWDFGGVGSTGNVKKVNDDLKDTKKILTEIEQELLYSKIDKDFIEWFGDPEDELKALQKANQEKYALTIAAANEVNDDSWMLEKDHQAKIKQLFEDAVTEKTKLEYEAEQKAIEKRLKLQEQYLEDAKDAYDDFSDTIQDNTADIIKDWDNAWETMSDIVTDTVAEMAAELLAQNFIIPIALEVGSSMGLSWNGTSYADMATSAGSSLFGDSSSGFSFDSLSNFFFGSSANSGLSATSVAGGAPAGFTGVATGEAFAGSAAIEGINWASVGSSLALAGIGIAASLIVGEVLSSWGVRTPRFGFTGSSKEEWEHGAATNRDEIDYIEAIPGYEKIQSQLHDYSVYAEFFDDDGVIQETLLDYFDTIFTSIDEVTQSSINDVLTDYQYLGVQAWTSEDMDFETAFTNLSGDVFSELLGGMLLAVLPDEGEIEKTISTMVGSQLVTNPIFASITPTTGRDWENQQTEVLDPGYSRSLETDPGYVSYLEPIYEDITHQVSAWADTFNETFFDALIQEEGNEWDAFVRFASVVQDSGSFMDDFTRQIEEFGETSVDAFLNLETIVGIFAVIDEGMESITSTGAAEAIADLVDEWAELMEVLDDAHATVTDLTEAEYSRNVAIGVQLTGLTASSLADVIASGGDLTETVAATVATTMSASLAETITEQFILPINEAIGQAYLDTDGDLDSVLSVLEGIDFSEAQTEIDAFQDAINEAFGIVEDTTEEIEDLTSEIESFNQALDDIIAQNTLSDYEYSIYSLNQWYEEQTALADELGQSLDDLTYAYDLQLEAIQKANIEAARSDYIDALSREIALLEDEYKILEDNLLDAKTAYLNALGDEIDIQEDIAYAADNAAYALENVVESLESAMAITMAESLLSPADALQFAGNQYQTALAGALGGDITSLENLPGMASDYLAAAQSAMTDRMGYQALATLIYTQLGDAQLVAEDQLSEQEQLIKAAEEQVDILNDQVDAVNGIEESILTLIELEDAYNQATIDFETSGLELQMEVYQAQLDQLELINQNLMSLLEAETQYISAVAGTSETQYISAVAGTSETFDNASYLQDKVDQLNTAYEGGYLGQTWTTESALAAIEAAGYSLESHYEAWGKDEVDGDYSFAGGGTVSGSSAGYTIPTTFHGTEHITPDSQMIGVKEELSEIRELLFSMLNVDGDNKELLQDIKDVYTRVNQTRTALDVRVINPVTAPVYTDEVP